MPNPAARSNHLIAVYKNQPPELQSIRFNDLIAVYKNQLPEFQSGRINHLIAVYKNQLHEWYSNAFITVFENLFVLQYRPVESAAFFTELQRKTINYLCTVTLCSAYTLYVQYESSAHF